MEPAAKLLEGQSAVRSKAHALSEAHGDWTRNDLCATGLVVKEYFARRVSGWLTDSRCIAGELEKFQCDNQTQPKHHCQDELVFAILEGLRTQLQVDGKMKVCCVGPHFTEHDGGPIDEEDIASFYDDVK